MSNGPSTGARSMPKVQKTVMVPDDLYRLIAEFEKRTGASFTRITLAALLQSFFQELDGPSDQWMEYAVSLELGEIEIADVPAKRVQDLIADALAEIGNTEVKAGQNVKEVPPDARQRGSKWRKMIASREEDAVQKIIDYRAKLRKG